MSKSTKVEAAEVEVIQTAKMYDLDVSLASEEYYSPLEESLPYAISDSRGYIVIPETEIEKSIWLDAPKEFATISIKGGEPFSALMMPEVHISILGKTQPYWYYSNSPANRASKLAGQPICWYNSPEGQDLKAEIEQTAQSASGVKPYAYATKIQFLLLDSDMIPMHEIPLSCNFRGSACWHVLDELKKFYSQAEKTFCQALGKRRTSFDDRVRALFPPRIKFGSEYVGPQGQKSEAIRIQSITKPTTENMTEWCLGFTQTQGIRDLIWDTQSNYQGCGANRLPAPIALNSMPVAPAITAGTDLRQLNPGVTSDADPEVAKYF